VKPAVLQPKVAYHFRLEDSVTTQQLRSMGKDIYHQVRSASSSKILMSTCTSIAQSVRRYWQPSHNRLGSRGKISTRDISLGRSRRRRQYTTILHIFADATDTPTRLCNNQGTACRRYKPQFHIDQDGSRCVERLEGGRRARQCSGCGQTGHHRTTCHMITRVGRGG
jgi:hypothetical protein